MIAPTMTDFDVQAATVSRACAACNSQEGIEMHHLIPQVLGGAGSPVVPLCGRCHGVVHAVRRPMNLGALIREGQERSRAAGKWKPTGGSRKGRRATNPTLFLDNPGLRIRGVAALVAKADAFAVELGRMTVEAERAGCGSLSLKAEWFNQVGFKTSNGRVWTRHSLEKARNRRNKRLARAHPEETLGDNLR